jgi:5-methylcytosine-specific restriction endonuclease McrA
VQFSTTEEHVQLIERAKALLARTAPGKSLGELHLEAMRLLVASLEKQKFATTEHSRRADGNPTPRENSHVTAPVSPGPPPESGTPANEHRRGRHIPAAVRRAVYERDGARCTYIDEGGKRCQETHCLELHHRQPFGKRGAHTTANLTLHCRAHNALAAELDFGREHMAQKQQPGRHESLASEQRAARLTSTPD